MIVKQPSMADNVTNMPSIAQNSIMAVEYCKYAKHSIIIIVKQPSTAGDVYKYMH